MNLKIKESWLTMWNKDEIDWDDKRNGKQNRLKLKKGKGLGIWCKKICMQIIIQNAEFFGMNLFLHK